MLTKILLCISFQVTKIDTSGWSSAHPYLTLPESYNGNQLKSYGGHIKYTVSPHTQVYGFDDSIPTIIIKVPNKLCLTRKKCKRVIILLNLIIFLLSLGKIWQFVPH